MVAAGAEMHPREAVQHLIRAILQATGGALPGGMTIAWGSEDEMDAWRRNDDYVRLQNQATLVADGVAVTDCIRGQAIMDGMTTYAELIATVS